VEKIDDFFETSYGPVHGSHQATVLLHYTKRMRFGYVDELFFGLLWDFPSYGAAGIVHRRRAAGLEELSVETASVLYGSPFTAAVA
jgi:hypothetical protein